MIELCLTFVGGVGEAIGAGEVAVEMIETAVLGIDHDDMADTGEIAVGYLCIDRCDDAGGHHCEPHG